MRKIFKAVLPILAVGIFLLAPPAGASFWLKGAGFYYSPDYGKLKSELDRVSPYFDVTQKLEAGTGATFSIGYDLSDTWAIRLDAFSSMGKAEYRHLKLPETYIFKTSTTPIILSTIWRMPSKGRLRPYIGAGIGSFSSKLAIEWKIRDQTYSETQYEDSPFGFQALAGTEYRLTDDLFFSGELRYIFAKAEYPGYRGLTDCSTDWSGLFLSIGVGYKFGSTKIGLALD